MKQDFSKRIQSLSPKKRELLESYLQNNGINGVTYATLETLINELEPLIKVNQTGEEPVITYQPAFCDGKRELPVKLAREITIYLARAFTLCIVLADERMYPWYYQHFVQICSQSDDEGYTLLDFMEPAFDEEVIEETFMGYDAFKDVPDIIGYISGKIDAGYYLSICVDEYYLNEKSFYKKEHYVHESLIYGYDNSKRKLAALGFNANMVFDKLTFDYEMFMKAFEEGKRHYKKNAPYAEKRAILLLRPVNQEKDYTPAFNINVFRKDLNSYLQATGDSNQVFLYATKNDVHTPTPCYDIQYGSAVYDVLIKNLENLLRGKITIDYRVFHLMAEHKKVMYDRLRYIESLYNFTGIDGLIRNYSGIVEQFEAIRLKILGSDYSQYGINEQNGIKNIISTIRSAKEEELRILNQIDQRLALL